jgi:hypothetical protein
MGSGGILGTVDDLLTGGQQRRTQGISEQAQRGIQGATQAESEFIKRIRQLGETRAEQAMEGPSVAKMATDFGIEQATRQGLAASQAQRGISPGLAGAIAARNMSMLGVDAIARGAVAQAEEGLAREKDAFQAQLLTEDMIKQILASQRGTALQQLQIGLGAEATGRKETRETLAAIGGALAGGGAGQVSAPQGGGGGGMAVGMMNEGGIVNGKAKVKGDSPKNDFVAALLSPGEMVIPRTVVQDGPEAISEFAKSILKKNQKMMG